MSDLEFFTPSEGGGGYDAAAFERFKEQMKKSGAFIAAARKQEQRQKEKEDKLAKLLLKFIQTNQKSGILLMAARLLEENIPPSFILGIIILGNEDLKEEISREMAAQAKPGEMQEAEQVKPAFSLIANITDQSIPLKIKAEIDAWGKGIFDAGSSVPFRVIETALDKEGNIKKLVIDTAANVLDDYLAGKQAPEFSYDSCYAFSDFLMKGIMKALQKQIENQKELQ